MGEMSRIMADIQAVIKLHSKRSPRSYYCVECNKLFPCDTIAALGKTYDLVSTMKPINEYLEERQ